MGGFDIRTDRTENNLKMKLKRIRECSTLKQNKDLVIAYDSEGSLNGKKISTRYSELVTLHYLCQFAERKVLRDLTKEDLMKFLACVSKRRFQDEGYRARCKASVAKEVASSTLNLHKHILKKFMCYVHGSDPRSPPECVEWIKVKPIGGKEKSPEEMLTPEEIQAMIAATENPRDRALITLMAESGARLGEVVTARIRDVKFTERGFSLTVKGKTGTRTVPLFVSETDLKEWLNNYHPFKHDADAPLFTSYTDKRKKSNLKEEGVARIVRMASARAGVKKRVYPHLFRHTRATQLARLGWTEPMLKKFFGWDRNSKMPSVYVHLAETDIEDKYYEMYGKEQIKERPEHHITQKPLVCPVCKQNNPTGFVFCFNCSQPLTEVSAKTAKANRILDLIVADEELRQRFDALLEMAYRKEHAR